VNKCDIFLYECPIPPRELIELFREDAKAKHDVVLMFHCDSNCTKLSNCPWWQDYKKE
jgi:hypothetical protein